MKYCDHGYPIDYTECPSCELDAARAENADLRAQLQAANDVAAHYREQLAAERWRPASEVPPVMVQLVCRDTFGGHSLIKLHKQHHKTWATFVAITGITHWRPIAPPEVEAKP